MVRRAASSWRSCRTIGDPCIIQLTHVPAADIDPHASSLCSGAMPFFSAKLNPSSVLSMRGSDGRSCWACVCCSESVRHLFVHSVVLIMCFVVTFGDTSSFSRKNKKKPFSLSPPSLLQKREEKPKKKMGKKQKQKKETTKTKGGETLSSSSKKEEEPKKKQKWVTKETKKTRNDVLCSMRNEQIKV